MTRRAVPGYGTCEWNSKNGRVHREGKRHALLLRPSASLSPARRGHLDPQFLDAGGKPALLPLEGDGTTFAALLRRCGAGDVRPSTLLKELRAAGAVRKTADGRLEALQRIYIPHTMDEELIRLWGTILADIATTCTHNLTRNAKTPARFERAAVNDRVRVSALPEFRQFLNQEGQAFLERVDVWLTEHEARDDAGSAHATIRLGAGVYHVQD